MGDGKNKKTTSHTHTHARIWNVNVRNKISSILTHLTHGANYHYTLYQFFDFLCAMPIPPMGSKGEEKHFHQLKSIRIRISAMMCILFCMRTSNNILSKEANIIGAVYGTIFSLLSTKPHVSILIWKYNLCSYSE